MSIKSVNFEKRPQDLQNLIESNFVKLKSQETGIWNCNGNFDSYQMCGLKEYEWLIERINKKPNRRRKNFYILDLGTGLGGWLRGCAKTINRAASQGKIPKDCTVHIFGTRAESNSTGDDLYSQKGQCKIYTLGGFNANAEDLAKEFSKRHIEIENKLDLVTSRWSFRHFADPLRTFVQLLKLVRPEKGIVAMDGFFFLFQNQNINDVDPEKNMIQLLIDLKVKFIMNCCNNMRSMNNFVLKKQINNNNLPYSYSGFYTIKENDLYQIYSKCITIFKRNTEEFDSSKEFNLPNAADKYYGDKSLFNELQNFLTPTARYFPIQRSVHLNDNSFHEAIRSGNTPLLLSCFENDMDAHVLDSEGKTPLCLAIELNNKEMFESLIENGIILSRCNGRKNETPMHTAAKMDHEGYFIKRLMELKADIYKENKDEQTPLDCAILSKNIVGVGLLLGAGVCPSAENEKALENPLFATVYTPPPEEHTPNALSMIFNFIKSGDCVVLYGDGSGGIMYNAEIPDPKQNIHYIDVQWNGPGSPLGKDEWPSFIALEGYQAIPYDKHKLESCKFAKTFRYQL